MNEAPTLAAGATPREMGRTTGRESRRGRRWIAKLRVLVSTCLIGALAGGPAPGQASTPLDLSQTPVFLGIPPAPNVMLVLDTSASMQEEHPAQQGPLGGSGPEGWPKVFNFPPSLDGSGVPDTYGAKAPGGQQVGRFIPFFNDSLEVNLLARSSNGIFYDPELNYLPWRRANATFLPDVNPDSAPRNPGRPAAGTLDLDSLNSWSFFWGSGPNDTGSPTDFWPITFYVYDGTGSTSNPSNYTKYQIREDQAYRANPANARMTPISEFSWPGGTRTIAEEKQNFANWYSYYRSRALIARGALAEGFLAVDEPLRVGWADLSVDFVGPTPVDGVPSPLVRQGVRDLDQANLGALLDFTAQSSFHQFGTITRSAIQEVGEYFSRADDRGPWSTTPGQSGGKLLACQRSNVLVATDGFWTANADLSVPPLSSVGNVDGTAGSLISGPSGTFQYTPSPPFADASPDMLADIGMFYWNRDLVPTLANKVPPTADNPSFWQNLTASVLLIGQYTGNISPAQAETAVQNGTPLPWPSVTPPPPFSGAGPNLSAVVRAEDTLHLTLNTRGRFIAADDFNAIAQGFESLLSDFTVSASVTAAASASATRLDTDSLAFLTEFESPDWIGGLTAVTIESGSQAWSAATQLDAATVSSRSILTSNAAISGGRSTGGTSFDAGLSSSLKSLIDPAPATATDIINYVRGEAISGFRARTSILGDIVNSKPALAGPGNEGWSSLPAPAGSNYAAFVNAKAASDPTVYVGANAGMLHGFDASPGAGGGSEKFAFVPRAVLPKLEALTQDPYAHQFFVDGQQTIRDAWDGSGWRRVLVGTLGAGGRGVYALDVTDPDSPTVLWELTGDDDPALGDPDLGFVFGEALITRLGNSGAGNWKAIFGNGYNSASGDSILYSVDLFTGTVDKVTVEAGGGGLSAPELLLDPATRLFTFRVYAGDLNGTLWRVDFDDSGTPSVTYSNGLFTAANNRPITSAPGLAASPSGGLLVYFGTGTLLEADDRLLSADIDSFYAVRDQGSALGASPALGSVAVSTSGGGNLVLDGNPGADGWVLELTDSGSPAGERVLEQPRIIFGQVIFSTFEPVDDPCESGGIQRVYVLGAITGSGALDSVCNNCGVVEVGIGAPSAPPVVITPPPAPGAGAPPNDPADPFNPGGSPPGPGTVGPVTGWCAQLGLVETAGTTLPLGKICDGRQVWRQAR